MTCKKHTVALITFFFLSSLVWSGTCQETLSAGRAALFDGTLSGVRQAHDLFAQGIQDPNCAGNREMLFFHAISRIAMWAVREDGGTVNSAMELAKEYDVQIYGDFFRDIVMTEPQLSKNRYDSYDLPADAEQRLQDLLRFIDRSAIPEIEAVIAALDQIYDLPEDRFRVYLTPAETQVFLDPDALPLSYDIEVDYGEVLLLKGWLYGLKALLQARSAYDLVVDPEDRLLEKWYGDSLDLTRDVLMPHPEFLQVLPTSHDPNDGKTILAQARQDWIGGLRYVLGAVEYILSEDEPAGTDPQEDELLWIDPGNTFLAETIGSKVQALADSLDEDTSLTLAVRSLYTYALESGEIGTVGQLDLEFDFLNEPTGEGAMDFAPGVADGSEWEVNYFEIDGDYLYASLENTQSGYRYGYLWGTINEDRRSITNASLEYWGDLNGTIGSIAGNRLSVSEETITGDLNPVFGSSSRYPEPVSPRDLLPELDPWNQPLPGTVGKGLGEDAALGGMAPGMTQKDWTRLGHFQPAGNKLWSVIAVEQIIGGRVGFWLDQQRVLSDLTGDVCEDLQEIPGTDIFELFMGYDADFLHGCIVLQGIPTAGMYQYVVRLSYSPTDPSALDSLQIEITLEEGYLLSARLLHRVQYYGWNYWSEAGTIEAESDLNRIHFKIPFDIIPSALWGRYVTVNSSWGLSSWELETADKNPTHIQLNYMDTPTEITGTVQYNGYIGSPIYVQVCSDPFDPDESILSSTMITQPGDFVLPGIGLGAAGSIRAFTHLFGFDPFDMDALQISTSVPFTQYQHTVSGVHLTLEMPEVLRPNVWASGMLDLANREDVFAFDAIAGAVYQMELNRGYDTQAEMILTGRNGTDEIMETWGSNEMSWLCPVNGRYYLKVYESPWSLNGGTYEVRVCSDITCPDSDISGFQWVGVKDCRVDLYDFALLAEHWLSECAEPYWCGEGDFDQNGTVDLADMAYLIEDWME